MKMRQSLAQFEKAFHFEAELDQRRREYLERNIQVRSRKRHKAREQKRSSKRFYLLAFTLIATAVIVTVAMFATLYLLLT